MTCELARLALLVPVKAIRAYGALKVNGKRPTDHSRESLRRRRKALGKRMRRILMRYKGQTFAMAEICNRLGIPPTSWHRDIMAEMVDEGRVNSTGYGKGCVYWCGRRFDSQKAGA